MRAHVKAFYHRETSTLCYVVADAAARRAAVIDCALDYERGAGRLRTDFADEVIAYVAEAGFAVDWILDTHAHADHLSAASYLKRTWGVPVAIGENIRAVQKTFAPIYNLGPDFAVDGSQFDRLLADGERLPLGGLAIEALATPGHTPACLSYRVGDAVFVGDTLFMPDYGSARTDFPGGDAGILYDSIRRLLALPPETRLFVCHDYGPNGRPIAWETSVAEQRAGNIHVKDGITREAFIAMRTARDAELNFPTLLVESLQVNIRAGRLPDPESNGLAYLKIPINGL